MADNEELKNNLVSFRKAFQEYPECYTVIGGAACFILMNEVNLEFRATKDVDMILILEDRGEAFAKAFWDYIVAGGYTCGWKESEVHYYRFTDPKPGYPAQIELFSRRAGFSSDSRIIPVHISEDVSSLSAIVLDDDFYDFMMQGRTLVDGLSILDAGHIIPFKMFAWLENIKQRNDGKHVNTDDIRKHKNDVFRLIELINPDKKITVTGHVRNCVERFLSEIVNDSVSPVFLKNRTFEDALDIIKKTYLV